MFAHQLRTIFFAVFALLLKAFQQVVLNVQREVLFFKTF